jgi:hypothetical protein
MVSLTQSVIMDNDFTLKEWLVVLPIMSAGIWLLLHLGLMG